MTARYNRDVSYVATNVRPAMTPAFLNRQPAFTVAQRNAITTWSSRRPQGLRARIVTHHPNYLEIAEIFHRHTSAVPYSMNPTDRGTVFLARASGGAWELGGVETALAQVLILEAMSWAQAVASMGTLTSRSPSAQSDTSDIHA